MHPEGTSAQRRPPVPEWNLYEAVPKLAFRVAHLDPGSAAALRRGPLEGAGSAAFWKLTAELAPDLTPSQEPAWASVVQAVAILTPRGRDESRKSAHHPAVPFGRTLYAAGLSELRLARLLTAPPPMRRRLSVRLCRWLAASEVNRCDVVTLAHFMVFGGAAGRRIARDYYRAEAAALRRESEDRETNTDG